MFSIRRTFSEGESSLTESLGFTVFLLEKTPNRFGKSKEEQRPASCLGSIKGWGWGGYSGGDRAREDTRAGFLTQAVEVSLQHPNEGSRHQANKLLDSKGTVFLTLLVVDGHM